MKHKTYGLALLSAVLLCCGALAALSLGMEPLVGDLTRVGKFRENEHGCNEPQRRFPRRLYDSDVYEHPYDVVVWGDSFSFDAESGWENYLAAATGATITAIHHAQMPLDDILSRESFRNAPPKVFVYEIVERSLKSRLGRSERECRPRAGFNRVRLALRPQDVALTSYLRPRERSLSDINLSYALDFVFTTLVRRWTGRIGEALELKLKEPLFSSRAGDSLLVFKDDLKKKNWTAEDMRAVNCGLLDMQEKVQADGKTLFLAVIIPDKLSAYSEYLTESRWARLSVMEALDRESLNYPRIDSALGSAIRNGAKDIYLPDDTHLGSAGHRIVAEEIIKYLRRRGAIE